jgi:hypothetical protein
MQLRANANSRNINMDYEIKAEFKHILLSNMLAEIEADGLREGFRPKYTVWNNLYMETLSPMSVDEKRALLLLVNKMNLWNCVKLDNKIKEKVESHLQSLTDKGYISVRFDVVTINDLVVLPAKGPAPIDFDNYFNIMDYWDDRYCLENSPLPEIGSVWLLTFSNQTYEVKVLDANEMWVKFRYVKATYFNDEIMKKRVFLNRGTQI